MTAASRSQVITHRPLERSRRLETLDPRDLTKVLGPEVVRRPRSCHISCGAHDRRRIGASSTDDDTRAGVERFDDSSTSDVCISGRVPSPSTAYKHDRNVGNSSYSVY